MRVGSSAANQIKHVGTRLSIRFITTLTAVTDDGYSTHLHWSSQEKLLSIRGQLVSFSVSPWKHAAEVVRLVRERSVLSRTAHRRSDGT